MTSQHGYPQQGGNAAGRGIVLVIVAIALGVFLLARGFDGSDDAADDKSTATDQESNSDSTGPGSGDEGENGDDTPDATPSTSTTTTTSTTVPPPVTHPANEVRVAAINGKGAPGLAGAAADKLNALGYQTKAKNAVNFGIEMSVIYYQPGYGDDAKAIAAAINAPVDILNPAPSTILTLIKDPSDVSEFNIFILLAEDDLIPVVV